MRGTTVVATAALLAATACATPTPQLAPVPLPPGAKTALTGIVQDAEGYERLSGTALELSIVGRPNEPIATAATDQHGNFVFADIPPGTYVLRIGRQRYTEQRMRVTITGNEQKPLDVRLRAVRGERCLPSRLKTIDCP
jgi:hypothetical protein